MVREAPHVWTLAEGEERPEGGNIEGVLSFTLI